MKATEKTTHLCRSCPKLCRYACPVADAEQTEATTPWGKMSAMAMAEKGEVPFDSAVARLAYKCLNCRASEQACQLKNPVSDTLDAYRAKAFRAGISPAAVYSYVDRFRQCDNPYGIDLKKELDRLYPREQKGARREIVYFPGCTEIRHSPRTLSNSLKLLRRSGLDIGLFTEPVLCCGYPLFAAGDLSSFREVAEVQVHQLKKYREVVTGSPACLYTMESLYRSLGLTTDTRFSHTAETLAALIKPSGVHSGPRRKKRVAYHDPCYLGRYRGTYDAPRNLLVQKTGGGMIELPRARENSYCCGAGGLLPITSPETSQKIAEERLGEILSTGARAVVTACPTCVRQFQRGGRGIEVFQIADFLSDA